MLGKTIDLIAVLVNTYSPIVSKPSCKVTVVRNILFANAPASRVLTDLGTIISLIPVSLNAFLPMVSRPSFKVTFSRFEQP
ncbi:Uncharacterised protein [Chlamydia abortus]|nr:Uncharacterised protein [Chlamydia abortus]